MTTRSKNGGKDQWRDGERLFFSFGGRGGTVPDEMMEFVLGLVIILAKNGREKGDELLHLPRGTLQISLAKVHDDDVE